MLADCPSRRGGLFGRLPVSIPIFATFAIACSSVLAAGSAFAQDDGSYNGADTGTDPWAGVEQMTVTGSGSLGDLLVESSKSVATFDDSYIQAIGAQNVGDIAAFTPNLEITSAFGASNPELFIRGVGLRDANATAASSVAIIQDGVYLNSAAGQLSSLFDTASLSVLRGPEATKYGRNATAGAILVESNLPSGDFGGALRIGYGRFNELAVEGFVEAPVIPDLLSWRAAFKIAKRDGTGTNRCGTSLFDTEDVIGNNERTGTKCFRAQQDFTQNSGIALERPSQETNNRDNWAAKTFLRFTPTPELELLWNAHGFLNRGLSRSFQAVANQINPSTAPASRAGLFAAIVNTRFLYFDQDNCIERDPVDGGCLRNSPNPEDGDPFAGDFDFVGDEDLDVWGTNLKTTWASEDWTILSVTAFEFNNRETVTDFDATPFRVAQAALEDSAWQLSEDFRVSYDAGSDFTFTVGAFYLYEELTADNLLQQSATQAVQQEIEQTTHYLGVFGFGAYELSETITIEGGIRLNYDQKDFDIDISNFVLINGNSIAAGGISTAGEGRDVEPTGELVLRYDPTESVGFYSKLSRGFKGRIFNGGQLIAEDPAAALTPATPEFVTAIEAGWKVRLFDDIVQWNGAGFIYDYEDQQVFRLETIGSLPTPIPVVSNAEDSRIVGIETDLTINYEGLTLFGSFSYLFTEYGRFQVENRSVAGGGTGGPPVARITIEDFSGNQLVNAPEISASGYAQYALELGRLGQLTPRFDFNYKSNIFFTPRNGLRESDDERWVFNFRLAYEDPSGNLELAAWVSNFTNEISRLTSFVVASNVTYVISDPRTYGATLTLRF